jgi:hypothetical protein
MKLFTTITGGQLLTIMAQLQEKTYIYIYKRSRWTQITTLTEGQLLLSLWHNYNKNIL